MVNEQLAQFSNLAVYTAMLVYVGSFIAFAADLPGRRFVDVNAAAESGQGSVSGGGAAVATLVVKKSRLGGIAVALLWLATLVHCVSVVTRGLSVMRVPWGNMYEFALTGTLLVSVLYLVVLLRPRLAGVGPAHDMVWLGAFVVGPVLLTLGIAVAVWYTDAAALVPALQDKFWLAIHVFVATLSSSLFTVAFAVTVTQIVKARCERLAVGPRWFGTLPDAVSLETIAHRINAFAFPLWAFTVVAGAIWAQKAWGRYWGWDPKEIGSFVVFVLYAAYLHARATGGWSKRAAWFAVAGFAALVANFTVVNTLFEGLHSYGGIG